MANKTIHDLSELMTPAQDDELAIWDLSAGQTLRIKRSTLVGGQLTGGGIVATGGFTATMPATGTVAMRGIANTFTADQTFSASIKARPHEASDQWSIDAGYGSGAVVPDTYVFQFSASKTFSGLVLIANNTTGQGAVFMCAGGQVAEVADASNSYSKTKDTASSTNVYYDAGLGEFLLQNKTGAAVTYRIFSIRIRAST